MGGEEYAPPPGPPPGYSQQQQQQQHQIGHVSWAQSSNRTSQISSNNPYHNAHLPPSQGPPPSSSSNGAPPAYEPPPGPPPGWIGDKKAAPPNSNDEYAPPPGPPPHRTNEKDDEPPPYDPWMAVPDSSLLPPPPSLRDERSPGSNAAWDDAAKGHAWCRQTPLWPAQPQTSHTLERIQAGDIYLTSPPASHNNPRNILQLTRTASGRTHIRTGPRCTDTIFLSDVPVYPALSPSKSRTLYYELQVVSMGTGREEAGIALGFLAPPYPSWRLPGWHRASIGVHGDDGRRFVDDSYGGVDFVAAFRANDVVGLGMTIAPPSYVGGKNRVECFFTRNGREEGRWDLHEEVDSAADVGDVEGLEGGRDVLAAVGCFGGVEFEAVMASSGWRFRPEGL